MKLLSLDLEMNRPSGKIIQIGACILDLDEKKVVDAITIHVNPNEQLADYITHLTGITQSDVNTGLSIDSAYEMLVQFHNQHDAFCNPLTWGQGDVKVLYEQISPELPKIFGRRIIDVKTLYVAYRMANGKPPAGGLAKSMTKFGLKFEGQKHQAVDDANNTCTMYLKMLEYFKEEKQ